MIPETKIILNFIWQTTALILSMYAILKLPDIVREIKYILGFMERGKE